MRLHLVTQLSRKLKAQILNNSKMERIGLKQDVIASIKSNSLLYGKVGNELKMAPTTLIKLLYDNDKRLTQAGVLKILGKHLGKKQNELLEEIRETNLI
jgi:hypothetical protein